MLRAVLAAFLFLLVAGTADARPRGQAVYGNTGNSQFNPSFLGTSGQYETLNLLKTGGRLQWGDLTGFPTPDEVNSKGYPLFGSVGIVSHGGITTTFEAPPQSLRAGHYVPTATGGGAITLAESGATTTMVSCTGTATGTKCDNSACSTFTGSIAVSGSNGLLTVTAAPTGTGCSLVVGQPISNGSTFANQFGVPTIIIGKSGSSNCPSCTGAGGTGTYLVNWPQTITSTTFNPGIRAEIAVTANTETTINVSTWRFTINSVVSGNIIDNAAVVHASDESLYAAGQLAGVQLLARIAQSNFSYIRDLNWADTNGTNVTTWARRKPADYIVYGGSELRNSLYGGVASYALNGSSNDYSVNLGASLPVDKQTVCTKIANTATTATVTFSIDNGTNKFPALDHQGNPMPGNRPANGDQTAFTFDAFLQTWISTYGAGNILCLHNSMPPEAFVQVNIEAGTSEWVVEPYQGSDPITDYMIQYAMLIKSRHPSASPVFEPPDETWNCSGAGAIGPYASLLSKAYIAVDATWSANRSGHGTCGTGGDFNNWTGKVASTLAQAIRQVSPTYNVAIGVQGAGLGASSWNANVLSNSYVGQNSANIATQSGCAGADAVQTNCPTPFTKTAAYLAGANVITPASYWVIADQQNLTSGAAAMAQVSLAWCYFYQGAGCASQSSVMTTYASSASGGCSGCISGGGAAYDVRGPAWQSFANTCAGGASCTPMTVQPYEGAFFVNGISSDIFSTATASDNGNPVKLSVSPNACVAGMTVTLSSLSGGTWSTAAGSYTVQAAGTDSTHCQINLDASGLGTLSSARVTYTGSSTAPGYVTYFQNSFFASADFLTQSNLFHSKMTNASTGYCAPASCMNYMSLYNLAVLAPIAGSSQGPFGWGFDLYGYMPIATCSSCNISGTSMTLGGTVTGNFSPGLSGAVTVFGKGLSLQTVVSCTQVGTGPAGSNAGDVCTLSGAAGANNNGVSVTGNLTPSSATNNPNQQWESFCTLNGRSC